MDRVKGALIKELRAASEDVEISGIGGGFTGASKYMASVGERKIFLKVADSVTDEVDASLLELEAKIYDFLEELGLTGVLFPEYQGLLDVDGLRTLMIRYLDDVSWGGPWNGEAIRKLDEALHKLHSTKIDEEHLGVIEKLSSDVCSKLEQDLRPKKLSEEEIEKRNKPFFDAWSMAGSGFLDSKGEIYFAAKENLAEKVISEAKKDIDSEKKALIMHDLNFANIGFSDQQAYFVDPLFLRMGLADSDQTVVGVNILQQLGQNGDEGLKKLVVGKYITNKTVLAKLIKYYVISSAMKLDEGRSGWQKFHQECSVVALNLFQDWDRE